MRHSRIVFWQGELSPHQSSYLRALTSLLPETTIIGVFANPIEKERMALGWAEPDPGRLQVILSPEMRAIEDIALHDPESTIHIFGGIRLPLTCKALRICASTNALIGVLSEARRWQGWAGKLRILHSYFCESPYRNRVDFVLAIGHLGMRWYEMCGYPVNKIFSWGYFVEKENTGHRPTVQKTRSSADIAILFVGQCIPRKGIEILLRALSMMATPHWHLRIVGDGSQRQSLEELAVKLGILERVHFLGVKANAEVREILARTDLFVLSSYFDGWGAVVNEALMGGVPVVCSEYCGAADLVRTSGHGETFQTGSTEDLARILGRWIEKGPLTSMQRSEIRAWSKCIEGEAAARYLIKIIEHIEEGGDRPVAPWFRSS